MSLIRYSADSDLYIYHDVSGGFTCLDCPLHNAGRYVSMKSRSELCDHISAHIKAGHRVPDWLPEEAARDWNDIHEAVKPNGRIPWSNLKRAIARKAGK